MGSRERAEAAMREDHNREIIHLQASIEREKSVAAKEASAAEERRMQDIDALEMQNRDATNEVIAKYEALIQRRDIEADKRRQAEILDMENKAARELETLRVAMR